MFQAASSSSWSVKSVTLVSTKYLFPLARDIRRSDSRPLHSGVPVCDSGTRQSVSPWFPVPFP